MPYIRPDKVSSVCLVRNRYRGSGFTLNGFSFSPKKLLYIILWRLRFAFLCLLASLAQYERPCVPAHSQRNLICCEARTARTCASRQIGLLHVCRVSQR